MFDYKQRPWSRSLSDEEYDRAVGKTILSQEERTYSLISRMIERGQRLRVHHADLKSFLSRDDIIDLKRYTER
jgi:hypothetical protein